MAFWAHTRLVQGYLGVHWTGILKLPSGSMYVIVVAFVGKFLHFFVLKVSTVY